MFLAVQFQIEDIIEHHAGQVERGRRRDEQADRPYPDPQQRRWISLIVEGPGSLNEEEAHRHVGRRGEDIRQAEQLQVALQARRRIDVFA